MAKRTRQQLKVIFDTNILITENVAELVRKELIVFIGANAGHLDLQITWYLPEIVINERQYQMQEAARQLLPAISKIEKLLGHNLNITEAIVDERVRSVIDNSLATQGFTRLGFNSAVVDWQTLVSNAAFRKPPFEAGRKEKGFRDSIIVETLLQLVEDSPQTPSLCLVALVSADTALVEAATTRCAAKSTVRFVKDLEELGGLINTLVSAVSEDVVAAIRKLAGPYFFTQKDATCFYFRDGIYEKIATKFAAELAQTFPGVDSQEQKGTFIALPEFQRKVSRRYYWVTRIRLVYQPYRFVESNLRSITPDTGMSRLGLPSPSNTSKAIGVLPLIGTSPSGGLLGALPSLDGPTREELPRVARVFEIEWSISVDVRKRLSAGRVEEIRYIGIVPE
jgi:PIN domain